MAFPVIVNTNTTNGSTATSTPAVNLPASLVAGNLLVVFFRLADAGTVSGAYINWPNGWNEVFDASSDGADDQMAMAWKMSDGAEGATITLATPSFKFAALTWQISGWRTQAASQQLASDDFNRANENPITGNWTSGTDTATDLQIVSNKVQGVTPVGDGTAFYNAISWPDNQYSEVTLGGVALDNEGGPGVRQSAATKSSYHYNAPGNGLQYQLDKFVAGTYTNMALGNRTHNAGDVMRIEVFQTTLRAFQNGTHWISISDSSLASGNAGLFIYNNSATVTLDDWKGGSVGASPFHLSTVATGASTTPDPTICTPTGGAKDYLWLWIGGWEGEQTSPPASNPANYGSNVIGANSAVAGAIATNCRVASAARSLNAASEDPGSWTISVSDDWTAYTVAVYPAERIPLPIIVLNAVNHAASW